MITSELELATTTDESTTITLPGKWRNLLLLAFAELLAMSVWFSASAVTPILIEAWQLTDGEAAWLTMAVQIGFVVGSLGSALLNLADRLPSCWLFAISSLLAGLATASIAFWARDLESALVLRFFTGLFLAGVYPIGMKIMATWTQRDRGLGIGLLVGALVLGSASPHLMRSFGNVNNWRPVLYLAAGSAILGAIIAALFVSEGPFRSPAPRFKWRQMGKLLIEKDIVLANTGYLGHMWELFAMWTWIPLFILLSFEQQGISSAWASLAAFAVIGIGGIGSLVMGPIADRFGRTKVTIALMLTSGTMSLLIGTLYGGNPFVLFVVALIWGFSVVADSAQFSAAVSELAPPKYVGTALTLQTSLGFLLTLFSIRLIPPLVELVGWRFAFAILALGPGAGIWAMWKLQKLPTGKNLPGAGVRCQVRGNFLLDLVKMEFVQSEEFEGP